MEKILDQIGLDWRLLPANERHLKDILFYIIYLRSIYYQSIFNVSVIGCVYSGRVKGCKIAFVDS